jgi:hypothetical protein
MASLGELRLYPARGTGGTASHHWVASDYPSDSPIHEQMITARGVLI